VGLCEPYPITAGRSMSRCLERTRTERHSPEPFKPRRESTWVGAWLKPFATFVIHAASTRQLEGSRVAIHVSDRPRRRHAHHRHPVRHHSNGLPNPDGPVVVRPQCHSDASATDRMRSQLRQGSHPRAVPPKSRRAASLSVFACTEPRRSHGASHDIQGHDDVIPLAGLRKGGMPRAHRFREAEAVQTFARSG
jgi:hypothetical protein